MSVYTRSCICSLPSETIQEYDKAMQELQVQDALAAYKKSNPEKDFVAIALDNLLAPETCPNCKSSYDVRPTASHGTFITPCTLPHVAHSSHRVHCITLRIHHTVYTASRCAFITPCTLHHVAHSSHRVHCLTWHIHHTVYTASRSTFITPCTLHHVAHSSHRVHCLTWHLSSLADVLPLRARVAKRIFACGVGESHHWLTNPPPPANMPTTKRTRTFLTAENGQQHNTFALNPSCSRSTTTHLILQTLTFCRFIS